MHEHLVKPTIGVCGVTKVGIGISQTSPPGRSEIPQATGFAKGGPTVMDMQKKTTTWANHSRDVSKHRKSTCGSLEHSKRAKQAHCVIHTVIGKTVQLYQIRSNEMDSI